MANFLMYVKNDSEDSQKAREIFIEKGIKYHEISLTMYPELEAEMSRLTGNLGVPQIFIYGNHIGGLQELLDLAERGCLDGYFGHIDDSNLTETHSNQIHKPLVEHRRNLRDIFSYIISPSGQTELGPKSCTVNSKKYSRVFTGKQLVTCIFKYLSPKNPSSATVEAGRFSNFLLADKYICPILQPQDTSPLAFCQEALYTFYMGTNKFCLNGLCKYSQSICDTQELLHSVNSKIEALLEIFNSGKNFPSLQNSDEFQSFYSFSVELQNLDLSRLFQAQLKAFFLNIFNVLGIHAAISFGLPTGETQKKMFWSQLYYNIGGHKFTLSDIKRGILRGNKPIPGSLFKVYANRDPRKDFLVDLDPRTHFALIWSTQSKNPTPATFFVEEKLSIQLDHVTRAAFEAAIVSDPTMKKIPHKMKIYENDFGENNMERLVWMAKYLPKNHYLVTQKHINVIYTSENMDQITKKPDPNEKKILTQNTNLSCVTKDEKASSSITPKSQNFSQRNSLGESVEILHELPSSDFLSEMKKPPSNSQLRPKRNPSSSEMFPPKDKESSSPNIHSNLTSGNSPTTEYNAFSPSAWAFTPVPSYSQPTLDELPLRDSSAFPRLYLNSSQSASYLQNALSPYDDPLFSHSYPSLFSTPVLDRERSQPLIKITKQKRPPGIRSKSQTKGLSKHTLPTSIPISKDQDSQILQDLENLVDMLNLESVPIVSPEKVSLSMSSPEIDMALGEMENLNPSTQLEVYLNSLKKKQSSIYGNGNQ